MYLKLLIKGAQNYRTVCFRIRRNFMASRKQMDDSEQWHAVEHIEAGE